MNEIAQYKGFVEQLKEEIRRSQVLASSVSTRIMLELYWYIGQQIFEKQKELGWGNDVIKQLSTDLQKEFDSKFSFSPDNLHRMRQLYSEYCNLEVLGQRVPKLKNQLLALINPQKKVLGQRVPKIQSSDNQIYNTEINENWEEVIKKIVSLIPWGHNILIMRRQQQT